MEYTFDAVLHEIPDKGGAYVIFPWDIRKEFGKGRVKVHATFDGIPYDGSIVNMGVKDENGEICHVIGRCFKVDSKAAWEEGRRYDSCSYNGEVGKGDYYHGRKEKSELWWFCI